MRPIHMRNFGTDSGKIRVRYNNGSSVITGSIIRQISANSYLVSDGSTQMAMRLADTVAEADNPGVGVGSIRVTLTGSGASLAPVLGANTVNVQNGGTGYAVNDTITLGGGTGTAAVLTVTAVNSGAITTATITVRGAYTALPGTVQGSARRVSTSTTSGGGSGAVLDIAFRYEDIVISAAGTGYVVGQALTFTGTGVGTPDITVGSVDANGAITGFVFTSRATAVFNVATVGVASATQRIRRLMSSRITTVEGLSLPWSRNPASPGIAQIEVI